MGREGEDGILQPCVGHQSAQRFDVDDSSRKARQRKEGGQGFVDRSSMNGPTRSKNSASRLDHRGRRVEWAVDMSLPMEMFEQRLLSSHWWVCHIVDECSLHLGDDEAKCSTEERARQRFEKQFVQHRSDPPCNRSFSSTKRNRLVTRVRSNRVGWEQHHVLMTRWDRFFSLSPLFSDLCHLIFQVVCALKWRTGRKKEQTDGDVPPTDQA